MDPNCPMHGYNAQGRPPVCPLHGASGGMWNGAFAPFGDRVEIAPSLGPNSGVRQQPPPSNSYSRPTVYSNQTHQPMAQQQTRFHNNFGAFAPERSGASICTACGGVSQAYGNHEFDMSFPDFPSEAPRFGYGEQQPSFGSGYRSGAQSTNPSAARVRYGGTGNSTGFAGGSSYSRPGASYPRSNSGSGANCGPSG
ncbi:unnamed protein product [Notodromas monacha]|uniref:Uncharacterized protein n=1 Tax=Notodromas monacha TaxID=399045 RepID=A0A7R9BKP2_9CRUS|nr:unnamed protein product [Notodromas monacha]CAG0916164.1 unnamed protein product [Notodromas monacha]